ncbi:hypothetical protein [Lachnoclostridium sp. Marseille-P6806]|uniref:hypothetical protein n=1 Tax=Lachnoclostridium sp. Marseille-P6806 TaxID=2364793 RepID=UPI003563173C
MMMSEFIERVEFEPTAAEYQEIEREYMGCDIDKDQFCKEWKKNGGIQRLMRLRVRRIEELEAEVTMKDRQYDEMDARYCRKINQIQEDMKNKLDEAFAASDKQKEELIRVNRLYQEAMIEKAEAEKKLETIRAAFAILIPGKEVV